MKILGILGSPRREGSTALLLDAVLEGACEAGAEVERLDVAGRELRFCVACSQCHRTGDCIYDDGAEELKAAMLAADGIVLGSPVYMWTVTAQMKTLMDRCSAFVHCFLLEGKYGAAVATAGGSSQEEIAEFQNLFLQRCGAQTVGQVSALGRHPAGLRDATAADRARELGRELVAAIRAGRDYPEQRPAREPIFARMKMLVTAMGENCPAQYRHWQERGWL